jgi:hypothetical protein
MSRCVDVFFSRYIYLLYPLGLGLEHSRKSMTSEVITALPSQIDGSPIVLCPDSEP